MQYDAAVYVLYVCVHMFVYVCVYMFYVQVHCVM